MYCDQCGTQLPDNARFCSFCGKAFGAFAGAPGATSTTGRVARHVRTLGILWLVLSSFRLIPGLVMMAIFGPGRRYIPGVPFFVHGIVSGIGILFVAAAVVGLAAGWGLIQRESWARMLAIVLGCLNLLDPPFGTAIGIYTLWVLLPAESEREYRQAVRAA
jgi:zinc-ribbon domain